ncbi:tripartite tricarboxylate transporter substrate binding protein [Roseococcus thiosulfatophilus]|uniref:tripartite tricarboxylate transporter substrate binding protein n=1 Tax=Roseococcus thiosulfatophilus TaxID=35813 RepID=UPI001A8F984D|nr:tripartite tricarboxylate transporter substrate binding protein [Roseococcus thiosulfatophilus]
MASRRSLLAAPLLLPAAALAQPRWPERPVRVIVPFNAGGLIDVTARLITEPLGAELGQTFVVENLGGAGTTIGARQVARATPDGHTIMVTGAAHSVIPALFPDAGFDNVADFAPVSLISEQPFVLCVHPGVPASTLPELLAWLRTRGGDATFSTTGIGAASHLAGELLKSMAGVNFTFVSYRGTPAAVTDFLAGRVDMMIDSQTLLAPMIRDGRVKGIAVTTARRSAMLPDLPTIAEAGVAGYQTSSLQMMLAPAATPAPILATLGAAMKKVLDDPAVRARFSDRGIEVINGDAAALARTIREEGARWLPILRRA